MIGNKMDAKMHAIHIKMNDESCQSSLIPPLAISTGVLRLVAQQIVL